MRKRFALLGAALLGAAFGAQSSNIGAIHQPLADAKTIESRKQLKAELASQGGNRGNFLNPRRGPKFGYGFKKHTNKLRCKHNAKVKRRKAR